MNELAEPTEDDLISNEDIELLNKVVAIGDHFYLDENDNSRTDLIIR